MTNQLTGVLVGAHFRPPAKVVLERLPSGTKLRLEAEPTNEYDGEAVQVWVETSELPAGQAESLEQVLPSCGWTLDEFFQQREIQLGYLSASKNKVIAKLNGEGVAVVPNEVFNRASRIVGWAECSIVLEFAPGGEALVVLTAPDENRSPYKESQDD